MTPCSLVACFQRLLTPSSVQSLRLVHTLKTDANGYSETSVRVWQTARRHIPESNIRGFTSSCVFWPVHWPCWCYDRQVLQLQCLFLGKLGRLYVVFTWVIIPYSDALWESDRRIQQAKPTVTSRNVLSERPCNSWPLLCHAAWTRRCRAVAISFIRSVILQTAATLMTGFVTPCSLNSEKTASSI